MLAMPVCDSKFFLCLWLLFLLGPKTKLLKTVATDIAAGQDNKSPMACLSRIEHAGVNLASM